MIPNKLITAASFSPKSLQSPGTWIGHLPFAAWVIQEVAPKIFVELGTHSGNSYFAFCQSVAEAGLLTKCYAVDTWRGDDHAGQYGKEIFTRVNAHNLEHYADFSRLLRMAFDVAADYFEDESIELLHIDGLHTYEAVRHDFETWLPKLAPGAVVIFHDTNVRERNFGVWKLWKELQARYPRNIEFVHSYGLGVLQLNNAPDHKKLAWFQATAEEKQALIDYFTALGSWQLDRFELNELKRYNTGLNQVLAIRDEQIVALYHSTSWRMTRPLRFIGQVLKRFRHMGLRRRIACFFGMLYWPAGEPRISQGFKGEDLQMPDMSMDSPLISVVMPVYDACRSDKKHFLCALESIANQSYTNVELIVVDDGSTDNSNQVYDDFLSTRPDLRACYLSKKNSGQSSARNFGVKHCRGEYIAFIDQDDEWYRNKLEQVVPWLKDKRIDVLYTDADTIDREGNIVQERIHQNLFVGWPHPKMSIEDILFKDIFVMPGVMIMKKETFEKVGGFDEHLSGYEDDDLFLRLFEHSRIFYLPVPTLRWRFHSDNFSLSSRMLVSRSYYWRKLLENYTDNGADKIREWMISLRFFWEFIYRALDQYDAGNELYGRSIDGAREILPHLPKFQRFLFGFVFLLPLKYMMPVLILARKTLNIFR